MEAHEKVAPSVIWSIIGTAAMSVIIAIAGSLYKGQSKQVVMGSWGHKPPSSSSSSSPS